MLLIVCLQPFSRSAEAGAEAAQQEEDSAPAWVPAPMKRLTKLLTSCSSPSSKTGSRSGISACQRKPSDQQSSLCSGVRVHGDLFTA